MTDLTKSTPVRKSLKTKLVIAEQVVLYTALVAGVAFHFGAQYNQHQVADRQAAIHDAVKASATPAAAEVATSKK